MLTVSFGFPSGFYSDSVRFLYGFRTVAPLQAFSGQVMRPPRRHWCHDRAASVPHPVTNQQRKSLCLVTSCSCLVGELCHQSKLLDDRDYAVVAEVLDRRAAARAAHALFHASEA